MFDPPPDIDRSAYDPAEVHALADTFSAKIKELGRYPLVKRYGFVCRCQAASGPDYDSRPAAEVAHSVHQRYPNEDIRSA